MIQTTPNNRIFGLDLIRATAIILVVLGHGQFMLEGTILEGFPYFKLLDGVDLFFVLSGFLIGGILLKTINQEHFRLQEILLFWKRRWFRTLPAYYLILGLNYLVVKFEIIHENIDRFSFHFLTFTHNFKKPFHSFFWESWSLSVEEWFYILVPIALFIGSKIVPKKQLFILVTLGFILLPLLYRIKIHDPNIDEFWWDIRFRRTVLCRLDSIGYGLLAAWVSFYYPSRFSKPKLPTFILGLTLLVCALYLDVKHNTLYKQTFYFSIIPFGCMLLIPLAYSYKSAVGKMAQGVQHISKISYSMYLINLALVAEVIRDNFAPAGGIDGIVKYLIYWVVVITASTLLYRFFEKPMMDLRDRQL